MSQPLIQRLTLPARHLLCICSLFITIASHASSIEESLDKATASLPAGSRVSLIIRDNHGRVLLQRNNTQLIAPASTQKLFTALAAYYQLGNAFRFKTTLTQSKNGDTAIVFSGDPLLQRADLHRLLMQAQANGLKTIKGDLILDGSIFNGQKWSQGQSWSDTNVCFAAPATAISLNHNCVKGSIRTHGAGRQTSVYIPSYEPISVSSNAYTVSTSEAKRLSCSLDLDHFDNNHYQISGCSAPRKNLLPISIAVTEPSAYVSAIIREEAKKIGLKISGDIVIGSASNNAKTIAEHRSEPLPFYLKRMLKKSDNQIADALFKTVGYQYSNSPGNNTTATKQATVPGNFTNGAKAVRAILLENAGIDIGNAFIRDGSGLSRHNLTNADALFQVVSTIASLHEKDPTLYDALPISGVDGTLRYRRGLINKPLKGKIHAKTGHLQGVYNLAGFITTKNKQQLRFVLLIDGFNLSSEQRKAYSRNTAKHPIKVFYERFFNALYNSSPRK